MTPHLIFFHFSAYMLTFFFSLNAAAFSKPVLDSFRHSILIYSDNGANWTAHHSFWEQSIHF